MIEIKRIVCPIDFSDFSRRALDYAVAIARWYEARVTAVHVHAVGVPPAAWAPGAPAVIEPIVLSTVDREVLTRELTAFVDAERAERVPVDIRVAEGNVWHEIIALANTTHAELVVLGTHGRSGFERLLLGSVTEKIVRTAPCPVLTVPHGAPEAVPIAPGLFKRILCATDFSPASAKATTWAASLAQEADAELLLLHVMEAPVVTDLEGFPRIGLAEYRREYEQWSGTRLREAVPEAVRTCCTVKEVTSVGNVHREILRVAREHASELIVMGVAGHRGVGDRVFGSTTHHVVRAAVCPVLTVRAS
jgi:nucleotide-binding universal stress UspA family protein